MKIHCINCSLTKEFPVGATLMEIYESFNLKEKYRPIVAYVNNRGKSLNDQIIKSADVLFINVSSNVGNRAYAMGAFLILFKAIKDLYPSYELEMTNSLAGGIYCHTHFGHPVTDGEIELISQRMQQIINADLPIELHKERTSTVVEKLTAAGRTGAAKLIGSMHRLYSYYYSIDDTIDVIRYFLPPATGCIHLFKIERCGKGLLLRIPQKTNPDRLAEKHSQEKMLEVMEEHQHLQSLLGVRSLGELNEIIHKGGANMLINVSEAIQTARLVKIAETIKNKVGENPGLKMIMVSGPSSSGKTTFSKKLQLQLLTFGIIPRTISIDNYFVPRSQTPLDSNGEYDYETIHAIDLKLFNEQMRTLLDGGEIPVPTYNFKEGQRSYNGETMKLEKNNMLIVEGIHALNPELLPSVKRESQFLIYVSALTSTCIDDHNYIPTTENRLLRRILRDYKYRGVTAKETIMRWKSVRDGEEKWIFPYQENADAIFNSALPFEISLIKDLIMPVLDEVPEDTPEFATVDRLNHFLRMFASIPNSTLPFTSLVREFIGGSSLRY